MINKIDADKFRYSSEKGREKILLDKINELVGEGDNIKEENE